MNTKQLDKAFKKMLHSDLVDVIDIAIEDWDGDAGTVVFLEDFEEITRCSKDMFQTLNWYLSNPKKNYGKAASNNDGYARALAVIDKQTGSRHLEDFDEDSHKLVKLVYQLRLKYK